MEKNSQRRVVFRRIHGRIIPIEVKEGVAIAGAGVATAAVSGHVASNLVRNAAHIENHARGLAVSYWKAKSAASAVGPLFEHSALAKLKPLGMEALRVQRAAEVSFRAALSIADVGYGAAAGLIGVGVERALRGTRLKDDTKTRAAIGVGAGLASHFVLRTSFLKNISRKGMSFGTAAKSAAQYALLKKFGG